MYFKDFLHNIINAMIKKGYNVECRDFGVFGTAKKSNIVVYFTAKHKVNEVYKNTNFKVSTAIQHPKRGKNQLYRSLNYDNILRVISNPRTHTNKGYRTK